MLRKLACAALLLAAPLPGFAQTILDASIVKFSTSLEETVAEANQHHQGDHLIFFYDDSEKSRKIVQELFADERVAAYINTHIATLAVQADTRKGNRILNSYAGDGEGPRIVISAQRLDNFIMHKTEASKKTFLKQLDVIKNASTIDEARAALQMD